MDTPDGVAAPAQVSQGDHMFSISAVKPARAVEASATLLFLQPASSNLAYATLVNPFPFLTPHWRNQAIRPDFSPAFNIGLRYNGDCGGDIQLDWTHLNAFDSASTRVADPYIAGTLTGPASIQSLGPSFLIGPPVPFATATGVAHFAYDAVNCNAGMMLSAGSHGQARFHAGLQGARISQNLSTNFRSVDGALSFTDVTDSVFTGVGPRLGMDVHYLAGNLDFLGGMAGSLLIGTRQSRIDFLTVSPMASANGLFPNAQFLTSPDTTQVIPGLDAKLGACYSIPVGRFGFLKCEAGYLAAVYIDAINRYSLTEVLNPQTAMSEGTTAVFLRTAVELQSNFLVHGPYLKLSLQF